MTPFYLFWYTTYTILKSMILSLLLAIRLLLRRRVSASNDDRENNVVGIYQGTVCHQRRHPVHHSFRMTARYALIDLDRPPYAPAGYISAVDARRAAKTNGPVYLLRIPPSLGYERSPVNLYYCYDIEGSNRTLKKCLVEASNTPWGESVTFVFNPNSDLVPKSEYISPFMDMLGNWRLKVNEPEENMYAFISVQHPKFGNYFTASYTAKRINISSIMSDHDLEAFFWLMPHKVSTFAYWNAFRIWWKNVPFYTHPRIENPTYREEAFPRDEKIQFCPIFAGNQKANKVRVEERIDRCFIWKDSKWPWYYLIG